MPRGPLSGVKESNHKARNYSGHSLHHKDPAPCSTDTFSATLPRRRRAIPCFPCEPIYDEVHSLLPGIPHNLFCRLSVQEHVSRCTSVAASRIRAKRLLSFAGRTSHVFPTIHVGRPGLERGSIGHVDYMDRKSHHILPIRSASSTAARFISEPSVATRIVRKQL